METDDLQRMNKVLRHRLRNVSAGIKNAVTLLREELQPVMPPDCEEYFPLIIDECRHIQYLTNRMNLIFDPDSPDYRECIDPSSHSITGVIESVTVALRAGFPTADVDFDIAEVIKDCRVNYGEALCRILYEVLVNAVESAPSQTVKVGCKRCDSMLVFEVLDSGKGVAPDELLLLEKAFYTTKTKHFGLGLSIARQLVDYVGGTLVLEPLESGGMRGEISVPEGVNDTT